MVEHPMGLHRYTDSGIARSILLVEDNADDELLTLRAFRKNAFDGSIVIVRDGQEALDYLFGEGHYADRRPEDLPCLVLLDLKLPKIGGLEVLRRMRANTLTQFLPVVVLTSSDETCDILESYTLHANSFIRKPVDFNQFIEAIRQLGLYWLTLNVAPPKIVL